MLLSFRYNYLLRLLGKDLLHRDLKIAEIGCGLTGLCGFIKRRVVGCDLNFPERPRNNMLPVCGSVFNLPFRDGAFDLVLSSDMLEHLKPGTREKAINEMMRITSKRLVLSFPEGLVAQECDRKIYQYLLKKGKQAPPWLIEHIEESHSFPKESDLCKFLEQKSVKYRIAKQENLTFHSIAVKLESVPLIRKIEWWSRELDTHFFWSLMAPLLNLGATYRRILIVDKC